MSGTITYMPGVPCWVETLVPDTAAARTFYSALFAWTFSGPGSMPVGGSYYVARSHDADVAGIASLPPDGAAHAQWSTQIAVANLDDAAERARALGGRVVVGPLDAPPAGRLAVIEAPGGSTFALWEARERLGAQRVNEPNAWAMSALRARDLDRALPYYEALFGWRRERFDAGAEHIELLRLPGYVGGVPEQPVPRDVVAVAVEDAHAPFDTWSVDFWIDDVDRAIESIRAHGGHVFAGPFDAGIFRRAIVACPAGAIFSISRPPS